MIEKKKRDYSKEGKTVLEKPSKPVRLRVSHKGPNGQSFSFYRCSCGTEFVTRDNQVRSGKTSSCGCFAKKVRAHNIQTAHIAKHLKEIEKLNEVKKRKLLKEKYSKQYTKILLELSNK
ncbi:MAG: hypothetical protein PF445_04505 [Melioribacteraceae bacterium]|jgi:hypothetical protein|nr:hypothetical protein [Melioribacteraceae bacterium]